MRLAIQIVVLFFAATGAYALYQRSRAPRAVALPGIIDLPRDLVPLGMAPGSMPSGTMLAPLPFRPLLGEPTLSPGSRLALSTAYKVG